MLSKRERYIAIATAASVGLLVFDWYVLTPLMDYSGSLTQQKQQLVSELSAAARLMHTRTTLGRRWRTVRTTTVKHSQSEAEGQLLNAQRSWSQAAGLVLDAIKPERNEKLHDMQEVAFATTGSGTMRAATAFLYRLETAPIPLRIRELQLTSRTEGGDDLTLAVRVSTLCDPPVKPGATTAATRPTKELE